MADLYVPCPRCEGRCTVFAYTRPPTDFTAGVGEYFNCPLCGATGEADADSARAFVAELAEQEEG